MTRKELKQLIRETIEQINEEETIFNKTMFINGMRDDMSKEEFEKQVVQNAHDYGKLIYPNDPTRAKKQANWRLNYDEDHWGTAYWYYRDQFGHAPGEAKQD
jgi:hypothetical protein